MDYTNKVQPILHLLLKAKSLELQDASQIEFTCKSPYQNCINLSVLITV